MKKLILLWLCFGVLTAGAQTVDEVIQKHTDAVGGLDAIKKINTVKITGSVTVQGLDLPITTQVINGKAMRSDIDVMGQSVVNAYKDGKGWKINPFGGASTATEVTGTELQDMKSQSMLISNLMDYKARGHQVELAGQEETEGVKTYKIKLINKENSRLTTYYISTTDNLLVKSTTTREMQGQEAGVENIFNDYKDFNGVKFSMKRTQKIGGNVFSEMQVTSVELNVPVDEKIFEFPK